MPAQVGPDGGGPGPTAVPWPNWQRQAMRLTLASGQVFQFPRNPTDFDDTKALTATDRPTLDGFLTYVWTPDPQQITLQGFTREEGVALWYQFRADFLGKLATFEDGLTQQRKVTLVTDARIQASQKPSTYRWQVVLKEAQ